MLGLRSAEESSVKRRVLVSILGIVQIFAWGSTYYLLAVLAKPIARQTGWPLAWIIGGLSFALVVAGIASPIVGQRIQEYGGRLVLAASSVLLALGLTGLAHAVTLTGYFAAWAVLGLGMASGLYDAAFATIGRLFGHHARTAITMLTLFGGFSSTVCWPLSAMLVAMLGWRKACLVYAGFHLAIGLPAYLVVVPNAERPLRPHSSWSQSSKVHSSNLLMRDAPQESGRADGMRDADISLGSQQLLLFLMIAASLTLGAAITSAMSVHLLTILQARGTTLSEAVSLGAIVGPSQVGARVYELLFGRRYHPTWTFIVAGALMCAGLGVLLFAFPMRAAGLVLYGGGAGMMTIARGTLPLVLFDEASYAVLLGRLALPNLLAQAIAPPAIALLLQQRLASETLALLTAVALLNLGLIVTVRLAATTADHPA